MTLAFIVMVGFPSTIHEDNSELLLDSESIANKILKNQHFHKATQTEREHILKGILSKGPASSLASKMARVVSDKHETYRQRIDAMKKLLDMHTDSLKEGKVPARKAHASDSRKTHSAEGKDKTTKKSIEEAEKLIHHHNKDITGTLRLSKKDAAIKKESETAHADPKKLNHWMKQQVKKKVASGHGKGAKSKGSYARLVKWAEAHGLPASLANNPAKQSKVKHIIAQMKADAEVERIRKEFAHDDASVGDVIHSADPSAASAI
eukprot:CAMPEP_0113704904 /NCGR_PEP_ID=MMETSP0038_2-20120614/26809_1 /TAXON_ID=2898 /ORGANISM="Cryptomonas paramecium" /LENGTH=263 /DNA_ID=CAMNT_0000629799 /DNA_START=137 /DNA_END=928 /DNA_ORIENTATION=+ /assembly_acc=CAM_ASM_000170